MRNSRSDCAEVAPRPFVRRSTCAAPTSFTIRNPSLPRRIARASFSSCSAIAFARRIFPSRSNAITPKCTRSMHEVSGVPRRHAFDRADLHALLGQDQPTGPLRGVRGHSDHRHGTVSAFPAHNTDRPDLPRAGLVRLGFGAQSFFQLWSARNECKSLCRCKRLTPGACFDFNHTCRWAPVSICITEHD